MCGRYILRITSLEISRELGYDTKASLPVNNNVAPTQMVNIVKAKNEQFVLDEAKWGFSPKWDNAPTLLINLKSETIASKKFASRPLKEGRCILPASGFFEWKADENKIKHPVLFELQDSKLFGLAGLLSNVGENQQEVVVLTTSANKLVATVHNRMPVMVAQEHWEGWINEADPLIALKKYAQPFDDTQMKGAFVSNKMNSSRYIGAVEYMNSL
jgi:putative SOS response-associated peptidase YedK